MADKKIGVFETLSKINVNDYTNEKGGLTYLAWSHAWRILQENYPESEYTFLKPIFYEDGSCEVVVEVTVESASRTMTLPVMDYKNKAIQNPNSRDISDTKMRCLVKAIAMFGLGLYVYSGLQETVSDTEAKHELLDSLVSDAISLIDATDKLFLEFWENQDKEVKTYIWGKLSSSQHKAAHKLLDKNNN